jgi:hypothetical protein
MHENKTGKQGKGGSEVLGVEFKILKVFLEKVSLKKSNLSKDV